MTQIEAMEVLALLRTYYHREKIPESTENLWVRNLRAKNYQAAVQAVHAVSQTHARFPAWATLAQAIDTEGRKVDAAPAQSLPPESERVPPEAMRRASEYVSQMFEFADNNPGDGSWGERAVEKLHEEFGES